MRTTLLILTLLIGRIGWSEESDSTIVAAKKYIEEYQERAIREMKNFGIPASITLAQGMVETANGKSELAQNANNHFGIKCHENWKGETYTYTDDEADECFRKYNSPLESYTDHSYFLKSRPWYAFLFKLDKKDYIGWAKGLKKAGYATNPRYAQMLIDVIEKYGLNKFDEEQPELEFELNEVEILIGRSVIECSLSEIHSEQEVHMNMENAPDPCTLEREMERLQPPLFLLEDPYRDSWMELHPETSLMLIDSEEKR